MIRPYYLFGVGAILLPFSVEGPKKVLVSSGGDPYDRVTFHKKEDVEGLYVSFPNAMELKNRLEEANTMFSSSRTCG